MMVQGTESGPAERVRVRPYTRTPARPDVDLQQDTSASRRGGGEPKQGILRA